MARVERMVSGAKVAVPAGLRDDTSAVEQSRDAIQQAVLDGQYEANVGPSDVAECCETAIEARMQKLRSETLLLQWLANHSNIPVPRILSPKADQHRDFIIMDKLPGVMLLNIYGTFDTLAKARFQSYRISVYR